MGTEGVQMVAFPSESEALLPLITQVDHFTVLLPGPLSAPNLITRISVPESPV